MVSKKKSPIFSIILPTHNLEKIIGFAIESVLSQSYSNFELLIIGDGCTDDTEKVVEGYMEKDGRINWFPFPKGKGFGYEHRNAVLKKARGQYIAFAAHDDLWLPDHLELFAQYFRKNPNFELAYSRPLWIDPDGTILPSCFNTSNPSMRKMFLHVRNEVPAACVVHTKRSAQKIKFMNVDMPEGGDWDMWRRLVNKTTNKSIGFISSPTTLHFRANWRTKRFYRDIYLDRMYELISKSSFYKKTFYVKPNRSEPLQKAAWMLAKAPGWADSLRNMVIAVLDEQARMGLAISASKKTRLKYVQKLENDLALITSTKGYKALNMARKMLRLRS